MMVSALAPVVEQVAGTLLKFSDQGLAADWRGQPAQGVWQNYVDTPREFYFQVYLELRRHAVQIRAQRIAQGPPITMAQEIMARHHAAYLDLRGLLLGVGDHELDLLPAEGEWPLRAVLQHIIGAEQGFLGQIDYALERWRAGDQPARLSREEWQARYGDFDDVQGTLHEIMPRYDVLHERALRSCSEISDQGLQAHSLWWEGYPVEVSFRMFRFDAHLREHTIQVEKTLGGIGHQFSEAERLVRLLYGALADAESALFGSGESLLEERRRLETWLTLLAADMVGQAG